MGRDHAERRVFHSRLLKRGLFVVLWLSLSVFAGATAVSAAGKTRVTFTDGSGRYLKGKGDVWCLYSAGGKRLSGLRYLQIRKKGSLSSGYYMFRKDGTLIRKAGVYYIRRRKLNGTVFSGYYFFDRYGRLSTAKRFRKLDTRAGGKDFRGFYYFGGNQGRLYTKKGWVFHENEWYYISGMGKRLEKRWVDGVYLLPGGKIARSMRVPDGSYVDHTGHKSTKDEYALSGLREKLVNMVSGYGGSWSVYVKDLKTGDLVNINDTSMYAASTIKAFVMAYIYEKISSGQLVRTAGIDRLLKQMITVSDNESFNQLVRCIGSGGSFLNGASELNRYLLEQGYTGTGCHHTLHPSSSARVGDGSSNAASAKDAGLLLERIYRGKCVSKQYSQEMLNLLLQQTRRWKIPAGLPAGTKVANKTGETSAVQHDMAIVFGPGTDYVLCVFTTGGSEYSANQGIRNISSVVYQYLNR